MQLPARKHAKTAKILLTDMEVERSPLQDYYPSYEPWSKLHIPSSLVALELGSHILPT